MRKLFRLHYYSKNKKSKITTFSLKGKVDIWWEDVNNVIGIREEKLTLDDFERLFRKKYISERYCDGKAKEFYELKMDSMTDEENTTEFLELLRYVPYFKDDKVNIQRFIK